MDAATLEMKDEVRSLRHTLRDLVALSPLPEVWAGTETDAIARNLAEVLCSILSLDGICVRLPGRTEREQVDAICGKNGTDGPQAESVREFLTSWIDREDGPITVPIPNPWGTHPLRLDVVRCGYPLDWCVLVAASVRESFPTEAEHLLLSIAANHAAMAVQRAQAEEELRRSEQFLRRVVESSQDCIKVLDLEGRFLSLSRGGQRLLEVEDVTTLLGTSWIGLWKGADRDAARNATTEAASGGTAKFVGYLPTVSGKPKFWDVIVTPIFDQHGKPESLLAVSRDITERTESDAFRAQLAAIVESSDDAIIGLDLQGVIECWNRGAEQLFGYPAHEIIGASDLILIPSDRRAEELAILEGIRRGEHVAPYETVRRCKDGQLLDVSLTVSPVSNGQGEVVGASKIARDISERKRLEASLREREEWLFAMVSQTTVGIARTDLSGRFTFVNRRYCEITGYTCEELLQKRMQEITHPDDLARNLERFERMIRDGQPYVIEKRYVRPDRSIVWVSNSIHLVRDKQNVPQYAVAVSVDVTDERQAREALQRSEERLRRMINVGGVGVITFAADGALVNANDTFLTMFGYAREEVDARTLTWRDLTPPESVAEGEEQLKSLAERGRIGPCEKEYLRKDGTRSWMLFAGASLGDGTFVEYCIDVSDRKRLEESLKEADRRKDEFLALLGHELRNPLAAVRSGLDILAMEDDQNRRTVALMQEQTTHLVRLVDDLLDVSRIMRGSIGLRRERVNLSDLVERSVGVIRSMIESAQQELTVAGSAAATWVDGDPVRLAQVIENLLSNASKYTDRGGRIELVADNEDGRAVITVRDNGIGIEPELLPHIFEVFTQSSRALDRAQGGLGIGLALVKQLVELHEGTISVHSEGVGHGSTFVVTLPTVEAPVPPPQQTPSGEVARECRVLVVEDHVAAAEMFATLLSKLGDHDVVVVHDGTAALHEIKQVRPDIVFLDIGLPGMDGYEVARRIRQDRQLDAPRDLLLVALTGYGHKEDRQRSQAAGFDRHLVKPPSSDEINSIFADPRLLRRVGRTRHSGHGTPQGPHTSITTSRPPHDATSSTPGGSSAVHANLRQVKHDIGNTAYALKLAVQMLSDSRGDASLVDKVAKGLDSEARSLDQLMASLERAIDRANT